MGQNARFAASVASNPAGRAAPVPSITSPILDRTALLQVEGLLVVRAEHDVVVRRHELQGRARGLIPFKVQFRNLHRIKSHHFD